MPAQAIWTTHSVVFAEFLSLGTLTVLQHDHHMPEPLELLLFDATLTVPTWPTISTARARVV